MSSRLTGVPSKWAEFLEQYDTVTAQVLSLPSNLAPRGLQSPSKRARVKISGGFTFQ